MQLEIQEIKHLRKKFNLTQAGLAKKAGVSQSLIAKMENGRIDPTYSKVKRIIDYLASLNEKEEAKAGEFMVRKVISIEADEPAGKAVDRIRKDAISQLPVMHHGQVMGLVSEASILDAVSDGKHISSLKVRDVMKDAPPIVPKTTPRRVILDLLRFAPIILVTDNARIVGVISKSDVLKDISRA